jgi:hypothetical protein
MISVVLRSKNRKLVCAMMSRSGRRDRFQVDLSRKGLIETVDHCADTDPVREANIVAWVGSQLDLISLHPLPVYVQKTER